MSISEYLRSIRQPFGRALLPDPPVTVICLVFEGRILSGEVCPDDFETREIGYFSQGALATFKLPG